MSETREIIVHCGLHKTGTTAIQLGLANHFDACLRAGIYPYNGENGNASHHGLAATLSRNPQKSTALLKEVVHKIKRFNQPKTLLSSEDFQSILTTPETVQMLTKALKSSGAEKITYLIYLRNPIEYLTSMYMTLLFFEHDTPFDDYFEEIIEQGHYRYRKWKLHFNYREITTSLEQAGSDFIIRDYHQMTDGNAVADILAFLGAPPMASDLAKTSRQGVTKSKRKFTRYCRHVLGSNNTQPAMFNVFERHLEGVKLVLPLAYKKRLLERFEDSLTYTDRTFGTDILRVTKSDIEASVPAGTSEASLSYPDVFNRHIKSDLSPLLPKLGTGERRTVSHNMMKNWGWVS